jgi:hypothetical protein
MTDAGTPPTGNLQVFIVEDELLPLRDLEYDIRSAARLVALSVWLGVTFDDVPDDQLLDQEVVDYLAVRRISYGSPLTIDVQMVSWAISFAVSATPTLMALMKGIGRLRVDYATAGELDARRDATREDTGATRSERRSREYEERLAVVREAAADLRPSLDEPDARMLDHLVRQAVLRPELIQDSIDAVWRLSAKTVRMQEVTVSAAGDDRDDDVDEA